jgi:predicted MFS family arabinose efflux permease
MRTCGASVTVGVALATSAESAPLAPSVRTSRRGVVVAYALVAAATQMLWLTYAAITTDTAHAYGVSESTVGWLSEIFPLLYVVLAIPAGVLLDRWFRPVLASGAVLVATGGLIRLGGLSFGWALAGQVVVAIAQPIVLSAVGKLAAEYLPVAQRPTGIAIGSAGSFVGMLVAVLLGPTLGAHGHLDRLLGVEAALAAAAAIGLAALLRRPAPATHPEPAAQAQVLGGLGPARALWALAQMRILCGLVFIGFGVFVALSTWLQVLLHPDGVSDDTAGALLVAMILAGVVGCAALPAVVARRGAERRYMGAAVAASAIGCAALGALPWIGARGAVLVAIGVVLLPALPIVLAAAEQLAGTAAAGSAGAIVWMAGNLGGLVVALIVQVLVHHPLPAFLAMAVVSLLGAPLARRVSASKVAGAPAAAGA